MNYEEISKEVKELLTKFDAQIDVSSIKDETVLLNAGMDSMDILDFIMHLEDKFDINIPSNQFENFGDLVKNIENTLKSA